MIEPNRPIGPNMARESNTKPKAVSMSPVFAHRWWRLRRRRAAAARTHFGRWCYGKSLRSVRSRTSSAHAQPVELRVLANPADSRDLHRRVLRADT